MVLEIFEKVLKIRRDEKVRIAFCELTNIHIILLWIFITFMLINLTRFVFALIINC